MNTSSFLDASGFAYSDAKVAIELGTKVPATRKINGKALTTDISLSAADVGAVAPAQMEAAIQSAILDSWSASY